MEEKGKIYIFANRTYGLYYGTLLDFDPATGVARVAHCRHICRWYGRHGGITSLALHGLCGPRASDSLVAAPCEEATLTDIMNIFRVSDRAAKTFERYGEGTGE